MTGCSRWRDSLIDAALGSLIGEALQAHLDVCTTCATSLERWRESAARLDAKVQELAAADPAPGGPERVLARIASHPRPFAWMRFALALGIIASVALIFFGPGRPQPHSPVKSTALSAWRSPTQWLLRSPADSLLNGVPRLGEGF